MAIRVFTSEELLKALQENVNNVVQPTHVPSRSLQYTFYNLGFNIGQFFNAEGWFNFENLRAEYKIDKSRLTMKIPKTHSLSLSLIILQIWWRKWVAEMTTPNSSSRSGIPCDFITAISPSEVEIEFIINFKTYSDKYHHEFLRGRQITQLYYNGACTTQIPKGAKIARGRFSIPCAVVSDTIQMSLLMDSATFY